MEGTGKSYDAFLLENLHSPILPSLKATDRGIVFLFTIDAQAVNKIDPINT